ncbi:MAG: 4-hydroxy-tetrahydrodipicolinate synthase, partial [Acidimicrobiia bacterium]|nr:4-hydroxy-tetrahydrodipicolinate synthase [Acidimicrobiia bacterium]
MTDTSPRRPWTGVGTALVTPFKADGSLDEAAIRRLARRQIEAGVHFLSPCGTTGEAPTLSGDEKIRVVELVVEAAAGRVPVLAGAGGYHTGQVAELVPRLARAGASGILSVTPYYSRPTPEGLVEHYKAVCGATDLPVVLYNVPGRTGVNVDPATLARIARLPNLVGVKEASGNVTQMAEICVSLPEDFIVLSGDDALTLPLMSVGGRGVISVVSNEVPAEMVRMVEAAERGDVRDAVGVFRRLLPLMLANFIESNPGPVKAAMAEMGLL